MNLEKNNLTKIFLIGQSGSGKTTLGKKLSTKLKFDFLDTDEFITNEFALSISEIFNSKGELFFRNEEKKLLIKLKDQINIVVSTGGGLPEINDAFDLMQNNGFVIWIKSSPIEIERRLYNSNRGHRPLLFNNKLSLIENLETQLEKRYDVYSKADLIIVNDNINESETIEMILKELKNMNDLLASIIKSTQGDYPIFVGNNFKKDLAKFIKNKYDPKRIFLISDSKVFSSETINLINELENSNIKCESLSIDINETKKNLDTCTYIYDWLLSVGSERNSILISIGGGVTTDLVGFVASSWLRGLNVIHFPTSLAAMVDASIGGKTGVNFKHGKNLIGAFKQPLLIAMDTKSLETLKERELNSGWAEAIKHAFLFDQGLLKKFQMQSNDIISKKDPIFTEIIKRSVQIKAEIVSKDEFEKGTDRIKLNFGHTIGHSLEGLTEYGKLLHGEAVSIGMVVATNISKNLNLISNDIKNEIISTLNQYGLPTNLTKGIDIKDLFDNTKNDKKVKNGKINWVLLKDIGSPVIKDDVPESIVMDSIRETI